MGRGRAKGKKLSAANQDDGGSGEEEKIPAQKRRGRPQKSLKDEIDEDDAQKIEDADSEDTSGKETKSKTAATHDGNKRKRNALVKEKVIDSVKEENENGHGNGNGTRSITEESNKSNGFRQSGNRRKNKPRRAAEAVVECN